MRNMTSAAGRWSDLEWEARTIAMNPVTIERAIGLLSQEQAKKGKKVPGVYRLYDKGGTVLSRGESGDLQTRLRTHKGLAPRYGYKKQLYAAFRIMPGASLEGLGREEQKKRRLEEQKKRREVEQKMPTGIWDRRELELLELAEYLHELTHELAQELVLPA